jgi:diguanylate cyclase (GGDEF)-like protein
MTTDCEQAYETLVQFLYRAPIGLAQTTMDGDIEMINPMSAQLLMPLSPDGNLANLFDTLGQLLPQLPQMVREHADGSGVVCESLRLHVSGAGERRGAGQVLSFSLLKLDAHRLMAVIGDATLEVEREARGLARQLSDAARLDALTQMPNRAAVREQLQITLAGERLSGAAEFAVLFMNCDRFAQVNDTLGHAAGDTLLGLIAERLRSALRAQDRIIRGAHRVPMAARVGGDEFVVVLDGLRRADHVLVVARRLVTVLGQPYGIGTQAIHCGVSMGIVLRAHARGDADAVLQDASIAMAEAKRAGGSRYVIFDPQMRERAVRRGGLEAELRSALAGGQLFVVYQPLVGLQPVPGAQEGGGADGVDRCAGVEALVRWQHPTRGVVSPLEFIAIAEESGLIGEVGEFVLDTACRQFVRWQATLGPLAPRILAVNVSRAQLTRPQIVADVRRILEQTGMAPQRLQLEVTESLAAQDELVQSRLHELKALGLMLALDDFGTGYSSLASLHLLPVDTVKIDRSFVSEADTSHRRRVLIEATVRVAHSLGMVTVAEGIETEAQARVIRELGCEKGQGFLFSRPLPADDITAWLESTVAA